MALTLIGALLWQLISIKMEAYPCEESQVLQLLERVNEAGRLAQQVWGLVEGWRCWTFNTRLLGAETAGRRAWRQGRQELQQERHQTLPGQQEAGQGRRLNGWKSYILMRFK